MVDMVETLEKQGLNKTYTNILRRINNNSKAIIQIECLSDEFPIKTGLRQGPTGPG